MALFKRMADLGKNYDTTKFNQETKKLYVFKPQPHRFFCFFCEREEDLHGQRVPEAGRQSACSGDHKG
jgi:hypothetical protein